MDSEVLRSRGLDPEASVRILRIVGRESLEAPPAWEGVAPGDSRVVDTRGPLLVPLDEQRRSLIKEVLGREPLGKPVDLALARELLNRVSLDRPALHRLGLHLMPLASFGLLNGGAATSYVDRTRNEASYGPYFTALEGLFNEQARALAGKPKALAPAYYRQDQDPGPSFLEAKLGSVLAQAKQSLVVRRRTVTDEGPLPLLPWVQMVNPAGQEDLRTHLQDLLPRLLPRLPGSTAEHLEPLEGVQALVAALAATEPGEAPKFFQDTRGEPLGLPGGHGQVFHVLAPVFARLRALGKRWIWLGNIDNLGFSPEPVHLALMALHQSPGAFEFSVRTPMDTKGGILVQSEGRLSCADLGLSISPAEVERFEAQGCASYFNCATGLFDLAWLEENRERVLDRLPLRRTLNRKDRGTYVSVEQSAWEVLGLMEAPLVLAVEKSRRFLANKFICDAFATSGLALDKLGKPDLRAMAEELHRGLEIIRKEQGI